MCVLSVIVCKSLKFHLFMINVGNQAYFKATLGKHTKETA